MKHVSTRGDVSTATLQDVLDAIAANPTIVDTRKRDLRSAILSFGKLADRAPASHPTRSWGAATCSGQHRGRVGKGGLGKAAS
jgi:hypothetical protein